jgi:hypothetical protein
VSAFFSWRGGWWGSCNFCGRCRSNLIPGLTAWNAQSSSSYVISVFNVPVAQDAIGFCDGATDWEVSWNGIDGYNNGDVLQLSASNVFRSTWDRQKTLSI